MTERVAGRSVEQHELISVLATPSWRVLIGSPGSGKTTLVQALCEQAVAYGVRTLLIRPVQIEASIALSAVSDLVSRVTPAELERIDFTQRAVLDHLVNAIPIDDPAMVRSAVTALLRACSEPGPLLVVLDDAHWIDRQSAETLAFACRRALREHSVVAAFRSNETSLLFDALLGDPLCLKVRLGQLEAADIATIIGQESPELSPSLSLSLAEFADGNPLRAREIGRAARRGAEALFKNRNIRVQNNPLSSATEVLTAEQLEVLYVATQLRDASLSLLSQVFSVATVNAVLTEVGDAEHLIVVNRCVEFEHPLFADAVATAVPAAKQRELHTRIANVISDPIERGRHLSLSATDFNVEDRLDILLASKQAAASGSVALALQLAFRAMEGIEPPNLADANDITKLYIDSQRFLADLEFRTDQPAAAADRLSALEGSLPGDARQTRVSLDLANLLSWSTTLKSGINRYEDILSRPDSSDAQLAEAGMQLAFLDLNVRTADHALKVASLGLAAGRRAGGQIEAEALSMSLQARFLAGQGLDIAGLEEASDKEDLEGWLTVQCPPFSLRPFMLAWCEDARAFEAFALRRSIFRRRGSMTAQLTAVPFEAGMLCSRGRIAEARELVQLGVDIAEFDNPLTQACSNLAVGRLNAHLGKWEAADAALSAAELVFNAFSLRQGLTELASVRVHMHVTTGDHRAATSLGMLWIERLSDFAMNEPMIIPGILDVIEAAAVTQNQSLMDDIEARLSSAVDPTRPDIAAASAWAEASWLCASKEDRPRAASLLEGLVKVWADADRTCWVARAHLLLGRLARRDGARRVAAEHFQEALSLFESAEANAWVEITAAEMLRSVRTSATGPHGLTNAESEVARFAAAGSSNKEIAQAMFITERTVEAHLSTTYRKLGITRRAHLATALNMEIASTAS
jgi:DNA-binding CsgD family transcriptional regulator